MKGSYQGLCLGPNLPPPAFSPLPFLLAAKLAGHIPRMLCSPRVLPDSNLLVHPSAGGLYLGPSAEFPLLRGPLRGRILHCTQQELTQSLSRPKKQRDSQELTEPCVCELTSSQRQQLQLRGSAARVLWPGRLLRMHSGSLSWKPGEMRHLHYWVSGGSCAGEHLASHLIQMLSL